MEKFTDLELADDFVSISSATRDSTKLVCIFFNKLEVVKLQCDLQFKYQRCETCKQAVLWEACDHPVEQIDNSEKRGIDIKVKAVINDFLVKSVREVRPIDIFVHLNFTNTKENEMKDLIQPTLSQIQMYLKVYRVSNLGEGFNNTIELKDKININ